jgi:hypothetical protein
MPGQKCGQALEKKKKKKKENPTVMTVICYMCHKI